MKIIKLKIIFLIFIFILFTIFATGCINNSENKNNYAEDFEFTLIDETTKSMSSFKGSVVLLDLFGVNCQPCQYQMLVLDEISTNYDGKNLEIVSIDVWITYGETLELVNDFIDYFLQELSIDIDWTVGVDDSEGTLFNRYVPEDKGIPMMYILDENGNIYYSHSGYLEYSQLSEKLDELLN